MATARTLTSSPWAPFRIEPEFVGRVWGYRDLRPWYDRLASSEPIGEVWLSGDGCLAATGPHAGKTLGSLFKEFSSPLLGPAARSQDSPLLIKVIFAREKLSVQVHPDDALAQKYGQPRGKTECWYALSAEPGAQVAAGLNPGVTIAQVRAAIQANSLESYLNLLPISAGDMVLIEAGTVHAIWPGSILLEVQQNSDITYRLYDYGRPRELHIDKGLEATRADARAGKTAPQSLPDRTIFIDAEYFRVERIPVAGARSSDTLASARSSTAASGLSYLFAAAGAARISGATFDPVDLPARALACVPAAAPEFVVEDLGALDLIRISLPWDAVVPPGNSA
jgi:mannose-6-phosphate isomerase